LPAGLGEGQIAKFIEEDEVEAGEIASDASLASGSAFGLELVEGPWATRGSEASVNDP
jgi:hypothetical protein